MVDQPASIGALPVTVARDAGCTVAYLPGLTMRRIADLYPGEAKTDARDARVIADAARTLKCALFLSAFASLAPPPSRVYYERKISEGKRHNQALLCLARRRCDVPYAMIENGAFYQASGAAHG